MNQPLKVIVVGGDAARHIAVPSDVEVRRFGSQRDCGNGACRRALCCIRHRRVDCVVLMVRWLGHPASRTIVAACKRSGIDVLRVSCGASGVLVAVQRYIEVRHG